MHNASASDDAETNATACASAGSSGVEWNPDVDMSDGWESTYVKETHVSLAGVDSHVGRTKFFSSYVENAKGNVDQFKLLLRWGPGNMTNGFRPPDAIAQGNTGPQVPELVLFGDTGELSGRPTQLGNYTVSYVLLFNLYHTYRSTVFVSRCAKLYNL